MEDSYRWVYSSPDCWRPFSCFSVFIFSVAINLEVEKLLLQRDAPNWQSSTKFWRLLFCLNSFSVFWLLKGTNLLARRKKTKLNHTTDLFTTLHCMLTTISVSWDHWSASQTQFVLPVSVWTCDWRAQLAATLDGTSSLQKSDATMSSLFTCCSSLQQIFFCVYSVVDWVIWWPKAMHAYFLSAFCFQIMNEKINARQWFHSRSSPLDCYT